MRGDMESEGRDTDLPPVTIATLPVRSGRSFSGSYFVLLREKGHILLEDGNRV